MVIEVQMSTHSWGKVYRLEWVMREMSRVLNCSYLVDSGHMTVH